MKILALSGSLRADSYNTALLRAAAETLPPDVESFDIYEDLGAIPPYSEEVDLVPAPHAVAALRTAIDDADAVLIATPEYNGSIPGQLKNALDWVSRPVATNPMRNKPVAVVGASTGMFGAVWAQADLRRVLGILGARVLDEEFPVALAADRFDADLRLRDGEVRHALREPVEALVVMTEQRIAAAA